jgi:23S rRNA pseudouridine2605 synthase
MKRKRTAQPSRGAPQLIRINRFMSMCGIASRRKSEELVGQGRVTVNGVLVQDLSTRIDPARDGVFVDGKQILPLREPVYLVMNKPKDTITTLHDERGRRSVVDLFRSRDRVYPVGRLDRNTTGVLLFTNDGEFANQLMHPRREIPKSYQVSCDKPVKPEHLRQLAAGIRLEDGMTAPARVTPIPGAKGREVGITIHEGRNRQVRRMFETLGYAVEKLDRVAYGPVTKEGLPRGSVRKLTRGEITELKRLAGRES